MVALLIFAQWQNAADDEMVNEFAKRCIASTDVQAKSKGLFYPFAYLNDAAGWQDIFSLYGGGKSLPKMKAIAKRYGEWSSADSIDQQPLTQSVIDPKGVFQKLMPGGFKISHDR
jgi:hypothetical protein